MRIWIDGVPCSFVDVFQMAEEELRESATWRGLPRNQGELLSWRQRRVNAAIVPPDGDKIISVGSHSQSGHRARFL